MKLQIERFPYLNSLALFDVIHEKEWAIFLDSGGQPASDTAQYDILCMQPERTLVSRFATEADRELRAITTTVRQAINNTEMVQDYHENPFEVLKTQLAQFAQLDEESIDPFLPGAYGYCAYDLGEYSSHIQVRCKPGHNMPAMAMGLYSSVVVVNHTQQNTCLISLDTPTAERVHSQWRTLIGTYLSNEQNCKSNVNDGDALHAMRYLRAPTLAEYKDKFNRLQQYLFDGDCYQANLTESFSVQCQGDTWNAYRYLRRISPAPYAAYMHFPFATVLSNSPEQFLRCRQHEVVTSPIKGTRARDKTDPSKDKAIAQQLRDSEKDRAENVMIVDLMRNDLGKLCEIGSVETTALFALHSFSNVHHLISTIKGRLKSEHHSIDLFQSCFPGGSITGAPKRRSMEIIAELETHHRGVYCGSIAYFGVNGNLESNIAIRTMVVQENEAHFYGGGGVVYDSEFALEYAEIMSKVSMLKKSVGLKVNSIKE